MNNSKKHIQYLLVLLLSFYSQGRSETKLSSPNISGEVNNFFVSDDSLYVENIHPKVYLRIDLELTRTDQTNRTGQIYLSMVKVIIPDDLGEIV